MKLRLRTAAAFVTIAGLAGSVHADPPKQPMIAPAAPIGPAAVANKPALTPPPTTMPRAPIALDASKKLVRANAALRVAGFPAISAVQLSEARLSPMTPRLPNGAEITEAVGLSHFTGATADEPDGAYTLMSAGTGFSAVYLRVPTEPNKFYILNCRVQVSSAKLAVLTSGVGTTYPPVEDGHAFCAFKATSSKTNITIGYEPLNNGSSASTNGYFYGCELVK